MSDDLNPSGHSQPSLGQAYTTPGNPADSSSSEQQQRSAQSHGDHTAVDKRSQGDSTQNATATSLGRGIHGAPPGEEAHGASEESIGRHNEKEGDQMRAPGEGETADAVDKKPGATGSQPSLTSDLEGKKAEQAPAREQRKEERRQGVDVGGVLGQRGGPAEPTN